MLDIIHLEPFPLILNLDIIRALHPIILLANRWKIMSYRYHVTSPGDTYHTRYTVPHPKQKPINSTLAGKMPQERNINYPTMCATTYPAENRESESLGSG